MIHRTISGLLLLLLVDPASAIEPPKTPAKKIDFASEIRPILAQHCWSCHGTDEKAREAGLRLDIREEAIAKKAIVPKNAAGSELVSRIHSPKKSDIMPPPESKKPLSDAQKLLLKTWIEQGAEYTSHWAFETPRRPAIPSVSDPKWVRNPIDAFVLNRLDREKLVQSPEADKATLLRRVTLDLIGLPPTPEEVAAFLADTSADAYEKVVERLLKSPRYGERMAMAWLDAARYADTNGFNNDEDRTQWPWRDWVINAYNQNMPFDRFLTEQLAGDLLPNATQSQKVATAFLRNQVHNTEGGIVVEEYRVEYVADRVHTTATAFLGLSIGCARCHDHKFDPVTQKEYYQFFAYFNSIPENQLGYNKNMAADPFIRVPSVSQQMQLDNLARESLDLQRRIDAATPEATAAAKRVEVAPLPQEIVQLLSGHPGAVVPILLRISATRKAVASPLLLSLADPNYAKLQLTIKDNTRRKTEVEKTFPALMVMQEMPKPRDTFLLKRGQFDQHGDKVAPGVPASMPLLPKDAPPNRLGLAQWLTSPTHPLTARVAVNRWWASYFGTGLVKSVEDFGLTGDLPTHPELLDFLATELIRTGWDIKAMQRLIVTSATYRQSSKITKSQLERDPENHLLGRGARYRLPAETVRDNALTISGLLRDRIGGPSVKPYQPSGLWEDVSVERRAKYVPDTDEGLYRRSMYTFWKRTCPPPALSTFDAPNREVCVARRATTNTPLQALVLLNDPTYLEASRKLAERMMKAGKSAEEHLAAGFQLALARSPSAAEQSILLRMQAESLTRFKANPDDAKKFLTVGVSPRDTTLNESELAAWSVIASALLNLDETISRR